MVRRAISGRIGTASTAGLILLLSMVVLPAERAAATPVDFPPLSFMATGASTATSIATATDGTIWFAGSTIAKMTTAGEITAFPDPAYRSPRDLIAGPDGNLWFVNDTTSIGRITLDGDTTIFRDPAIGLPNDLVAGGDGNVWFSDSWNHRISRISPTGIVSVVVADKGLTPFAMAAAPDGGMWFLDAASSSQDLPYTAAAKVTPSGQISNNMSLPPDLGPRDLTVAPDGTLWLAGVRYNEQLSTTTGLILHIDPALWDGDGAGVVFTYVPDTPWASEIVRAPDGDVWFASSTGVDGVLGRVTPAGHLDTFTEPGLDVAGLTIGPDGNVWFGDSPASRVTPAGVITRFPAPVREPSTIVNGADGNLWFANGEHSIGRITPAGVVTPFADPRIRRAYDLTLATDGDLWFTNPYGADSIGRITPAGAVTTFTMPDAPVVLAAGADGNVWYLTGDQSSIGQITPAGVVTMHEDPLIHDPHDLTTGPDGNLWFTQAGAIGRLTPAGVVSTVTSPDILDPRAITTGPDGALWFTDVHLAQVGAQVEVRGAIGRVTVDGTVTSFPLPEVSRPFAIVPGDDGTVWFAQTATTEGGVSAIRRLSPAGKVTTILEVVPRGFALGPDGNLWFSQWPHESIMRLTIDAPPGAPTNVRAAPAGGAVNVTWAAAPSGHPASYTVTASPGGATCTWSAGPPGCAVTGLPVGGTFTFTVTATSDLGSGPASTPSGPVTIVRFDDVPVGAPFFADIDWLVAAGLANGYADGLFHPTVPVTRQATAAFLYRRAGAPDGPSPTCATAPFPDVPIGAPFCGEIAWLVGHGLANGYPDGLFRPATPVSRQAMAAFLHRAAGPLGADATCTPGTFTDVPAGAPFCAEISWLVDHDIANGFDDGTFRPTEPVSRQAMAAFLHRFDGIA